MAPMIVFREDACPRCSALRACRWSAERGSCSPYRRRTSYAARICSFPGYCSRMFQMICKLATLRCRTASTPFVEPADRRAERHSVHANLAFAFERFEERPTVRRRRSAPCGRCAFGRCRRSRCEAAATMLRAPCARMRPRNRAASRIVRGAFRRSPRFVEVVAEFRCIDDLVAAIARTLRRVALRCGRCRTCRRHRKA